MPTCTGKGALLYPVCRFRCKSHPATPSQAHGEMLSQLCAYPLPQSSWCIKCTITTQQSPQICIFARNGCTAQRLALASTSCLLRCCFWSCVLCTPRKGEYFKHSVEKSPWLGVQAKMDFAPPFLLPLERNTEFRYSLFLWHLRLTQFGEAIFRKANRKVQVKIARVYLRSLEKTCKYKVLNLKFHYLLGKSLCAVCHISKFAPEVV